MGKIKQKMFGLHLPVSKADAMVQTPSWENNNTLECSSVEVQTVATHNPFKNIAIPSSALEQKLVVYSKKDSLNFNVTSAVRNSKCSSKVWQKKKRARFQFPEVVTSILEFHKKREKEAKKEKVSILGNYDALKNALPDLQQLKKENSIKHEMKPRVAKCFSKQEAEMEEDIQAYQQILSDPQYASDPFGMISAQLKQKLMSGSL